MLYVDHQLSPRQITLKSLQYFQSFTIRQTQTNIITNIFYIYVNNKVQPNNNFQKFQVTIIS